MRIAINGFGRIGRQVARILLSRPAGPLELAAINTLEDIDTSAHLLQYDTTHGVFPGRVEAGTDHLVINGRAIPFSRHRQPKHLEWGQGGIDLVLECSGVLKNDAHLHIRAGARQVIVACSTDHADITICMGINQGLYDPARHRVISASNCTANCLAPLAKVLNDTFDIDHGMVTFLHSYTSDQALLDNDYGDLRRCRSATTNIIPTTTSGIGEMTKVLPQLAGRISGMALRIPSPVVHGADFTVRVKKRGGQGDLLAAFDTAASHELQGILMVNRAPLVSSDFKGNSHSAIVDAEFCHCHGDLIKVLAWQDNEHGYSSRLVDLAGYIASVLR